MIQVKVELIFIEFLWSQVTTNDVFEVTKHTEGHSVVSRQGNILWTEYASKLWFDNE